MTIKTDSLVIPYKLFPSGNPVYIPRLAALGWGWKREEWAEGPGWALCLHQDPEGQQKAELWVFFK